MTALDTLIGPAPADGGEGREVYTCAGGSDGGRTDENGGSDMTPEREADMRAAVYELQHDISCDAADLLFIALDQERARVAKLEQVADLVKEDRFGEDFKGKVTITHGCYFAVQHRPDTYYPICDALAALETPDESSSDSAIRPWDWYLTVVKDKWGDATGFIGRTEPNGDVTAVSHGLTREQASPLVVELNRYAIFIDQERARTKDLQSYIVELGEAKARESEQVGTLRARVARLERVEEVLRWVEEGEGWAWSDKTAQRVNDALAALETPHE